MQSFQVLKKIIDDLLSSNINVGSKGLKEKHTTICSKHDK